MSNPTPIPQHASDFMQGLIDLCKSAAADVEHFKAEARDLKMKMASNQGESSAPLFEKSEVDTWAGQLKRAGIIPESTSSEKIASLIEQKPAQLINLLIQSQLPPESQGYACEKQASTISGGNASLVDYDGWMDCLQPENV